MAEGCMRTAEAGCTGPPCGAAACHVSGTLDPLLCISLCQPCCRPAARAAPACCAAACPRSCLCTPASTARCSRMHRALGEPRRCGLREGLAALCSAQPWGTCFPSRWLLRPFGTTARSAEHGCKHRLVATILIVHWSQLPGSPPWMSVFGLATNGLLPTQHCRLAHAPLQVAAAPATLGWVVQRDRQPLPPMQLLKFCLANVPPARRWQVAGQPTLDWVVQVTKVYRHCPTCGCRCIFLLVPLLRAGGRWRGSPPWTGSRSWPRRTRSCSASTACT